MAKLTLTDISAGYNSLSVRNANNTLIEAAIENTLSRDGTAPNQMEAALDMNSWPINNLPDATNNQQPITLAQAASIASVSTAFSQENVGAALYPRTAEEISAGVTPTNYYYEPGNVLRYGTNTIPGTTDMTTALQNCADVCAGTANPDMVIPQGNYLFTSALDFREVKVIRCNGKLQTTLTGSVDYIKIGTSVNSNTNMDGADIQLYVINTTNSGNNNTGLENTTGIAIRGTARGKYRLYVYNADTGVSIEPTTGEYVAFNEFTIGTNGCHTCLDFNASGTAFINQNTFYHVDLYSAGDNIAGNSIGLKMTAGGPNNNVFLHTNVESQDTAIYLANGSRNYFYNIRNESSGPVIFGDNTTQETTGQVGPWGNVVEFAYDSPNVTWQAERPNVWYTKQDGGVSWINMVRWSYLDMVKVGGQGGYTSRTGENSVTGDSYFTSGVRTDSSFSFDPGSNHRLRWYIPVEKGDILRVIHDVDETSDTSPNYALLAMDINKSNLAAPATGTLRYIGSTATTNIAGTTDANHNLSATNSGWSNPILYSINRDEVKYVAIQLISTVEHIGFQVEKMTWGKTARFDDVDRVIGTTDLATIGNVKAGQIVLGDSGRVAIGAGNNGTTQLTQLPTATAANIASSAHAINTTHKVQGLMVYDTTNNRIMVASGGNATSPWYYNDGGSSVTPS